MRTMRACFSIFKIKAAEAFQYRASALAGAATGVFWVLIEVLVYTVFYKYAKHGGAGAALTLRQAITYSWIAQALFLLQVTELNNEVQRKITNGDVGIELCRPMDLYFNWYAKLGAEKLIPFFWRGTITLLVGFAMPQAIRPSPPASVAGFLAMLLSCFAALLFSAAFAVLISAIRLKIAWGDGPVYILMLGAMVLSGGYLPLQLWPDVLQKFLLLQPFSSYLDIPMRLYLGTIPPRDALGAIGLQLCWTLILIVAGRALMRRRLTTIVLQGG